MPDRNIVSRAIPVLSGAFLCAIAMNFLGIGGRWLLPELLHASALGIAVCVLLGARLDRDCLAPLERVIVRWPDSLWILAPALAALALFAANLLQYEALDGTLWDLSLYIQQVHTASLLGHSYSTFTGSYSAPETWHFSISLPILAWLYGRIQRPELLLFWQCVFAFLPGLVLLQGYRAVLRARGEKTTPLGLLLVFCCFWMNPVFSGQLVWPYVFHIAGMFFFALAYYFFYLKRWGSWALSLVLFALQKEEFGLYSAAFGALVLTEAVFSREKRRALPIALAFLILIFGSLLYFLFIAHHGETVPFSSRFGNLGSSPFEAARNLVFHPGVYVHALLRAESLGYIAFFVFGGLGGIGLILTGLPRWGTLRYFMPCFPFLLAQAASQMENLHLLKDHYAQPLIVGSLATLVYGVLGNLSLKALRGRQHIVILALSLCGFASFAKPDAMRFARHQFALWRERSAERALLAPVEADREKVICCEERLCSKLADRAWILSVERCLDSNPLISEWSGKSAVFVVYSRWSSEKFSPQWLANTPLLKISAPIQLPLQVR